MSIITDSNIFTIHDNATLDQMPAGLVVTEMPRNETDRALYESGSSDLFLTFEVGEGHSLLEIDPMDGTKRSATFPIYPVRVVNPELIATAEDILGWFQAGQRVKVVASSYLSDELQPGAVGTVVGPSLTRGWDYRVEIDGFGAWHFNKGQLAELIEVKVETEPVIEDDEEPLAEWERELLMGPLSEKPASIEEKCCGKYDPCPKAEPLGVTVTVYEFMFAPVGN